MARPARLEPSAAARSPNPPNPDSGAYAVVRPRDETLTAYATHDAKNMLDVLSSNVEWLRDAVRAHADDGTIVEALDDIEACARRLTDIMAQALEPKTAVAAFTPRKSAVSVLTVVQTVYQQMRRQAAMSDVGLEVRVLSDGVALLDQSLIERVIGNLVDNALRFAPRGTTVRIGCNVVEDHVELTVSDDGPGVDKTECERLFEPYATTSGGAFPGESPQSGLGLAFCRTVARLHGGDVHAEPVPGGGGRFVVTLPLA